MEQAQALIQYYQAGFRLCLLLFFVAVATAAAVFYLFRMWEWIPWVELRQKRKRKRPVEDDVVAVREFPFEEKYEKPSQKVSEFVVIEDRFCIHTDVWTEWMTEEYETEGYGTEEFPTGGMEEEYGTEEFVTGGVEEEYEEYGE